MFAVSSTMPGVILLALSWCRDFYSKFLLVLSKSSAADDNHIDRGGPTHYILLLMLQIIRPGVFWVRAMG